MSRTYVVGGNSNGQSSFAPTYISISLSVYPSIYLSMYCFLFIELSIIYISIFPLNDFQDVKIMRAERDIYKRMPNDRSGIPAVSVCLLCLSVRLSVSPSVCPSICTSVCIQCRRNLLTYLFQSVRPRVVSPFACLSGLYSNQSKFFYNYQTICLQTIHLSNYFSLKPIARRLNCKK